ncbi:FG-GAP-like repeat-containing protein [Wenyingzhuangia sp. chi5]|uniref:FG-GAP-like repeat-containing protein n=1 Tax=Wenyingzhuangia gilva TaxID=3057677 RepID=A0ABT8VR45_9FLAO|nr:FG-GAP-like repeat-containing protein [Wenyingzhuangia sp. chi5]MDO3694444.1 FG-GAP-like repeat-containing protein [Wenyingzhuangia sp. chi5]
MKCIKYACFLVLFFSLTQLGWVQAQTFERIESFAGLDSNKENNGASIADFDQDGDLDIFVVAKAKDQIGVDVTISKLFKNNNNGTFTDVTLISGLVNLYSTDEIVEETPALNGYKFGAFWGDYNNDGYPDLFLTHINKIQLFKNKQDGTFLDVTIQVGLQHYNGCVNTGATWFDYNNDGFLDLYVSEWEQGCEGNRLYKNNGDGTFTNVSNMFQDVVSKHSYQSIPFDFNGDGWMDLYVANDYSTETNDLFINNNGKNFTEEAKKYGLDHSKDDMGIAIGDYNNDGSFNFFITAIDDNAFYVNNGNNIYVNQGPSSNVNKTGWAWDVRFSDFDLDGDEDLFILNGYDYGSSGTQTNVYYENLNLNGGAVYLNRSSIANLDEKTNSVSLVDFDYDNDGDIDLFVTNNDRSSFFYENKTLELNNSLTNLNWLKVKLEGTVSNRDAIGTKVIVRTKQGRFYRYYTGKGFLSQSLQPVHFGLGSDDRVIELQVLWPSGQIDTYNNISVNKTILAKEGVGLESYKNMPSKKIYGCTDPNSCNYNPNAEISTGHCIYLNARSILGETRVVKNSVEVYSYPLENNSSLSWSIEGGDILEVLENGTVTVRWGAAGKGILKTIESNEVCNSSIVELFVDISKDDVNYNTRPHSVARIWNETLLDLIRKDYARPTVHARNLFHTSIAMYDAWAVYDESVLTYLLGNTIHGFTSEFEGFSTTENITEARKKTISYAMYRLLSYRFKHAPNPILSQSIIDATMTTLGYDSSIIETDYSTGNSIALGNYIATQIINYGLQDGANEANLYANKFYEPVNTPLDLSNPRSIDHINPNRWQPLSFNTFIDQSGNVIGGITPDFLGPEWGNVLPFSLSENDKSVYHRSGHDYAVYHDPGAPPTISDEEYKWAFSLVSKWGSHLDPTDGVMWDISPKSIGNIDLDDFPTSFSDYANFYREIEGGDIGEGRFLNPRTQTSYQPQMVPRGDYTRVLAEFWADGPDSETPPGHWFTILNYVNDHKLLVKKLHGEGKVLDNLEWDVKAYFILGGAMHDAAVSAWGVKGWYDYIRPISAIRYMAGKGQSSDPSKPNYHKDGIPLQKGLIEIIEEGDALAGEDNINIGKIKLFSWRGHKFIKDPAVDEAGVGWILAKDWWPYQRPTFVTPPFAGYVSGHSTYSRAAAEVMTLLTGDEYFPGGYGEFIAKKNEFLVFEEGPSVDIKLQWATYRDASDQCSLSRIWGGIHPPLDDIPGRIIGEKIGIESFKYATSFFNKEKIEADTKIAVSPNPLREGVREIEIKNVLENSNIYLCNINGKVLQVLKKQYNSRTNTYVVKLPATLSAGIYILKVNNQSSKIIVL